MNRFKKASVTSPSPNAVRGGSARVSRSRGGASPPIMMLDIPGRALPGNLAERSIPDPPRCAGRVKYLVASLCCGSYKIATACRLCRCGLTTAVLVLGTIGWSASYGAPPLITALTLSPDNAPLVSGSQLGVQVASWPTLEPTRLREVGFAQIHDLKFSPNGVQLLIVGGAPGEYGQRALVSWPAFEVIATRKSHSDVIYSAAWLSENLFVTAPADGSFAVAGAGGSIARVISEKYAQDQAN